MAVSDTKPGNAQQRAREDDGRGRGATKAN